MTQENTQLTPKLQAIFIDAIHQVSGKTLTALDAAKPIAELGLDSVSVMEMVGALEDKLEVHFSDDELSRINTFADLAAIVRRLKPDLQDSAA